MGRPPSAALLLKEGEAMRGPKKQIAFFGDPGVPLRSRRVPSRER
jgi:hypothetical protein